MWYILKPILVTTLWIIMMLYFLVPFLLQLIIVFVFFLEIEFRPYGKTFNNKTHKWDWQDSKHDNNPIDTFKRYWNGDFW